jgi:hypothetical protein
MATSFGITSRAEQGSHSRDEEPAPSVIQVVKCVFDPRPLAGRAPEWGIGDHQVGLLAAGEGSDAVPKAD